GWWVEEGAMIGEWNIVEIIIFVVGVEYAPAGIDALHADDPLTRARNCAGIAALPRVLHAVKRHRYHRGVVDVGIMRIGILKRPAARPHIRPLRDPVAAHIQNLFRNEPIEAALGLFDGRAADLDERMASKPGVPDRRDAWLRVNFVIMHAEQLLDGSARDRAPWVVRADAKRIEHHDGVRHGRINRAKPVFAVQALLDPGDGAVDRALAQFLRKPGLDGAQHVIDPTEEPEPR